MTLVVVDARNVLRSRWPNVPERALLERVSEWAKTGGHRALVVFDGRADGEVGRRDVSGECTVVGTGSESADDWIADAVAALPEPYWLVTSDRELRRRAGGAAERTIGGGAFLHELGLA